MSVSISRGSESTQPLVGQVHRFDNFEEFQVPIEETLIKKWGPRIVSVGGLGLSLALRIMNLSEKSNVLSCIAIGNFALATVTSLVSEESFPRVRQISLTAFGQLSSFVLSQIYFNIEDDTLKTILVDTILAQLGANGWIISHWVYQHGWVRNESHTQGVIRNRYPEVPEVPQRVAWCMKGAVSLPFIAGGVLLHDHILKGLSLFPGLFFPLQVLGEKAISEIDNSIERLDEEINQIEDVIKNNSFSDPNENDRLENLSKKLGFLRGLKAVVITTGKFGVIISTVPWNANPDSSERIRELAYVGGALGLGSSPPEKSAKRRVERISITDLVEFKKQEAPKRESNPCSYYAYTISRFAVPIMVILGMTAFGFWEELSVLGDKDSKIGFGIFYGAFLLSCLCSIVTDWTCPEDYQNPILAKLFKTIWVSPRVLGIPPLFIFIAITNAMKMNNHAIESNTSKFYTYADYLGWLGYGSAMGLEFSRSLSDRYGNPVLKFPLMALSSGAIAAKAAWVGDIPA